MKPKTHILPVIIIAQFLCTSIWFAGNAVIDDFAAQFNLGFNILGYLLSMVQFGFIIGTLTFALSSIVDRFSPSRVFLVCAILGGMCNAIILTPDIGLFNLLTARFGTGFFLAGIYPVGMKIASDYYKDGLGKALGYLVGALVLGTALPHLLQYLSWNSDYRTVILTTTLLSFLGGIMIFQLVPDGPYRTPVNKLQLGVFAELFTNISFKKAAFGYFGHMWELYAFWGFIPLLLKTYNEYQNATIIVSLWSFIIIAIGFFSCVIGGFISLKTGSKKVAYVSLWASGLFCVCSPLLFLLPPHLFLTAICIWAMVVISDSPQFSTIVANAAPSDLKGTALTIVNCIGFSITIVSIQLISLLSNFISPMFIFILLGIGPCIGIILNNRRG